MQGTAMLDIQREADAMQMVWLQEHSALDAFAKEVQRDLEQLRGPRGLSWRPFAPERLTRSFHSFQLPEVPGADFSLSFSGLAAEQRDEGWRLSLTARGPVLQLAIALSLCYEIQGKRRPLAGRLVESRGVELEMELRGEWPSPLRQALAANDTAMLQSVTCRVEILPFGRRCPTQVRDGVDSAKSK
ncbi:unnamed protein product [Effrenium voratum]|uniref:Uncharacterized protein n=2 Tax=Effrenium voratum TaxID=2562239 RepID=A0AA36I1Z9_9DINO|nr:unnamed protein product [Effrenium voratum]CAJ1428266.1 unnamed protein product [Effrenium voratum]